MNDTAEFVDVSERKPIVNGMRAIHPGEVLIELWMEPMGLDIMGLSKLMKMSIKEIKPFTKKKIPVNHEIAFRLSETFGTSEELWFNMQNDYDRKRLARKAALPNIFVKSPIGPMGRSRGPEPVQVEYFSIN